MILVNDVVDAYIKMFSGTNLEFSNTGVLKKSNM